MLFFGQFDRKFRQHPFFEVAKKTIFSIKYQSPISKKCLFLLESFPTCFVTEKYRGVPTTFHHYLAFLDLFYPKLLFFHFFGQMSATNKKKIAFFSWNPFQHNCHQKLFGCSGNLLSFFGTSLHHKNTTKTFFSTFSAKYGRNNPKLFW